MTLLASGAVLGSEQGLHNHGREGEKGTDGRMDPQLHIWMDKWVDSMLPRTWEEQDNEWNHPAFLNHPH